jgi:glyoxylase-like metal-dependent hydrolase (beta-lactamase superfamily II)
MSPGATIELGGRPWQVHSAAGHDPDAVVLFEPEYRVLISGDALWRNKVSVIFPELDGEDGFVPALATLDMIESLNPTVVIPGHGEPFTEVTDALNISRLRLRKLQANPAQHARHALRVLMVFHLMEHRRRHFDDLCAWMANSPMAHRAAVRRWIGAVPEELAALIVQSLIDDGVVHREGAEVRLS